MEVYAGSGRGAGSVGGCARSARSHLFLERRAWYRKGRVCAKGVQKGAKDVCKGCVQKGVCKGVQKVCKGCVQRVCAKGVQRMCAKDVCKRWAKGSEQGLEEMRIGGRSGTVL